MKVVVIQPSYIPWPGYFYMMKWADIFVIYDTVQYDKNGWRNRNKVQVENNTKWITLSIDNTRLSQDLKGRTLNSIYLKDKQQFNNHREKLKQYYCRAAYHSMLKDLYPECLNAFEKLVDGIEFQTILIRNVLKIKTQICRASELGLEFYRSNSSTEPGMILANRNNKLISVLKKLNCSIYMSGPSAKSYIDLDLFAKEGINVIWNDFIMEDTVEPLSTIHYILAKGPEWTRELIGS